MTAAELRAAERDFLLNLMRDRWRRNSTVDGHSATTLILWGMNEIGAYTEQDMPADRADLARCELAFSWAPSHMQREMTGLLEEFRAHVRKLEERP